MEQDYDYWKYTKIEKWWKSKSWLVRNQTLVILWRIERTRFFVFLVQTTTTGTYKWLEDNFQFALHIVCPSIKPKVSILLMWLHKKWGQTLKRVGLYLPEPCFSHGQLYVAMSRVSRPQDITVFVDGSTKKHGKHRNKTHTKNIVYRQLLQDEKKLFEDSLKYQGENPTFSGNL